jgi:hypothetical protein
LEKKTAQDEAGNIYHGSAIFVMSEHGSSKDSGQHEKGSAKAKVSNKHPMRQKTGSPSIWQRWRGLTPFWDSRDKL